MNRAASAPASMNSTRIGMIIANSIAARADSSWRKTASRLRISLISAGRRGRNERLIEEGRRRHDEKDLLPVVDRRRGCGEQRKETGDRVQHLQIDIARRLAALPRTIGSARIGQRRDYDIRL